MRSQLVKVRLLAEGNDVSMVEYNQGRYKVHTNTLRRCTPERVDDGWIIYCQIDVRYLTEFWV